MTKTKRIPNPRLEFSKENSNHPLGKGVAVPIAALICLVMTSCTIVPLDPEGRAAVAGSAVLQATNVDDYLADYWEVYMVPEIYERRVELPTLIAAAGASGWEHAGGLYGQTREIGASYNFITHGTAVVRETNTESRSGFLVLELDGAGDYEVRVAIGPAFSGAVRSAIRDSIRFIDFNHFVNQVDFARLATEMNNFRNESIQQELDLFGLEGQTIEFTGSFVDPTGENIITIMPIFLEVR